jgi:hypothetical protein
MAGATSPRRESTIFAETGGQPEVRIRQRPLGADAPPGWGGLAWSPWADLDQAVREHAIPKASGLYRFRRRKTQPALHRRSEGRAGEGVRRGQARYPDLGRHWASRTCIYDRHLRCFSL